MVDAACRGLDPAMFYPEPGESAALACDVCEGCGVRLHCLEYALAEKQLLGIWGGHSERSRRRLRAERRDGVAA